jgi:DNA-binding transcriptional ArsR family regulator
MIRFVADRREGLHVRIAYSALWECVCSLRVVRDPARHGPLRPWLRRTRGVRAADVQLLSAFVRVDGGYIPDFLAPPPDAPRPTFAGEVSRLRATPPEVVRAELARAAGGGRGGRAAAELLARFRGDAVGLRDALADALERYWAAAIAPAWPRLESVLEGEVLGRARDLAMEGPATVLSTLHERVAHRAGAVEVGTPQQGEVRLRGNPLLLVPSVFAWPDVFTVQSPAWRASLYYPARGVGLVWEEVEGARDGQPDPLALLAGRARARLLRLLHLLARPATTGDLAAHLGAAPASVSAQLQQLHRGGLLERTRVGRRVFYGIGAAGRGVVRAVDGRATSATQTSLWRSSTVK